MKFSDFDRIMRVYETAHDHCVLPGLYIVVRLDGRGFTKLTQRFEKPFDDDFHDLMVDVTLRLSESSGFRVVYGYTQSDEISLLLHREDDTFGRKLRKLESVLAGEASGKGSLLFGDVVCFDARVCQLPDIDRVVDYFRWRAEDAHRNALMSWCYWTLRKEGLSRKAATSKLSGMGVSGKNELLFERGINYNEVPAWQRRGTGVYRGEEGWEVDNQLPVGDEYSDYIRALCEEAHEPK